MEICSEQEEEKDDWQKENQMGMQWDEDEKLEEILERRRMERYQRGVQRGST